jgi:mitogen-activated protein kinase 1/3
MDSDDSDSKSKNPPHSGDQTKKEVVKIEYPIKWLKHKHSFTIAGSEFIVDERYEYIKQIGVGAYGVVISCYDKKTNRNVAIKKVGNAFEDLIDAKRIVREIKLLRYFKHDNIVSLIDIQKPPGRTGFEDIYIITDLMETDLHRVIYSRQELTDDHIQYFIYQILRGVVYMHSANIIHRDLKPANILANKNCDLKICDLGLGRAEVYEYDEMELREKQNKTKKKPKKKKKTEDKDKKDKKDKDNKDKKDKKDKDKNKDNKDKDNVEEEEEEEPDLTEYVITRWYRAPEVILCPSHYSKAVDIWSVGCIFAELLGRQPLFPGDHYLDQIQKIVAVTGTPKMEDLDFIKKKEAKEFFLKLVKRTKLTWSSLFPNANPIALDLLEKMLTFNPKKRYTVDQCLSHPYFEGLHDPEQEPITTTPFDWTFDDVELTKENLQSMIYDESLYFHDEDEDDDD